VSAAFAHSTNAVFGKLAVKHLDGASLVRQAERLGFNRRLKVGTYAPDPSRASIPSGALELARMGAGFVNSTLSPLHAAVIATVIASGGRWPAGVAANGGQDVPLAQAQVLQPRTVQDLKKMMAMTSSDGTAAKYLASFAGAGGVAVKTGTLSSRDGTGLFNTWMVGFFPASRPEIAFASLVSTKGPGPFKAGHLTRQAIDNYLKLKRNRAGRS
jgi:cell division protein FtsI/penicillin-binding protein 2